MRNGNSFCFSGIAGAELSSIKYYLIMQVDDLRKFRHAQVSAPILARDAQGSEPRVPRLQLALNGVRAIALREENRA
jgi:hypothetical protein